MVDGLQILLANTTDVLVHFHFFSPVLSVKRHRKLKICANAQMKSGGILLFLSGTAMQWGAAEALLIWHLSE